LALLPLTPAYFPEMSGTEIRVYGCDPGFVAVVERRTMELTAAGFGIERATGEADGH
jgi:hypothetical protein